MEQKEAKETKVGIFGLETALLGGLVGFLFALDRLEREELLLRVERERAAARMDRELARHARLVQMAKGR